MSLRQTIWSCPVWWWRGQRYSVHVWRDVSTAPPRIRWALEDF